MSALSIPIPRANQTRSAQLHVVRDGELPASHRRRHAHGTAGGQFQSAARDCAALGLVATVFTIGVVTIVQAFLAVTNLPLP